MIKKQIKEIAKIFKQTFLKNLKKVLLLFEILTNSTLKKFQFF
ncbi:hypothetical protein HCCG_01352 [Helicobacter cinaedi CCUG 18818 = ATCC BAA-847]|uniref:Uncharacterized protein n=1 Tax=Helicobacter cinaedi CCUG 18818 = ATCC BAA-847 TaxID=537971 RepID=A0ABN0BCA5_9HELI|nr:hypothetical protein HCCG_01352 [Helicobacter cinaedi CCUG 18818 = ATCC BAA-847]